MITDARPYPVMKESCVDWLKRIPTHWETTKVKNLARPGYKTFVDGDWIESPYITSDGIRLIQTGNIGVGEYREQGYRYISEETFNNFGCTEIVAGDILICRLGKPVARTCIAPQLDRRMVTSVDVCILKPRSDIDASFLVYSMSSHQYLDWVGSLVRGSTRDRISRSMLGSFSMPLPPPSEQTAIVRFLDHADRRIRRYIRAKQKLIALLEEQKQAIIHQAVTGQIDVRTDQPYPAYKPSGVEWLGQMPADWDEISLGRCLRRIAQGWSPTAAEGEIGPDQWAVLTLSSVKRGTFDATAIKPIPISAKIPEGIETKNGDLLLTRSNTRKLVGDVCIVEGARPKTVISDLIYRLTPEPVILGRRFLMFQLLSTLGRRQIERDARGSSGTMPKIAQRHIRSWRVLIPPREEQRCIVNKIKDTEKATNNAVKGVRAELSLLHEYRTRLIADVVTGKLDVREAAAALPDDTNLSGNDRAEVEDDAGIETEALEMTDWHTCPAVERKPGKVSGAWVFAGTRIPLSALYENLASGATIDEFVEWFPGVDEQQVRAVLEHEAKALRTAAAP